MIVYDNKKNKEIEIENVFLGECFGVGLTPNGATILVEDDGQWFVQDSFDSGWLPDLITVLQMAESWMEKHRT